MYRLIFNISCQSVDFGSSLLNDYPYYFEFDSIKELIDFIRAEAHQIYDISVNNHYLPMCMFLPTRIITDGFEYTFNLKMRNIREYQLKLLEEKGEKKFSSLLKSYSQKCLIDIDSID